MFKLVVFCLLISFVSCPLMADTINVHWGDTITTCESGGDIIVPNTTPTPPTGHHFVGWTYLKQIEYLESTGTQWIDTGLKGNQDTSISLSYMFSGYIDAHKNRIYGSRQSPSSNAFQTILFNNRYVSAYGSEIAWNKNGDTNVKHYMFQNKNNFYVDNVLIGHHNNIEFTTPTNLYLFALYDNNDRHMYTGKVKIYYTQLYDNNTIVRDFIPVLDNNNIPCMYDRVENKYYYNAGTGNFIAGPVVNSSIAYGTTYEPGTTIANACNNESYFYPQFETNVIGITWDDGTNTMQNTCDYGEAVTIPPTPTRPGYIFNGWKVKNN